MKHLAPIALAALAAACAGAPPPERPPLELAPFTALRAEHFPGAKNVLTGFAPADENPSMRAGDAALLGLELHRGGAIERQLLLLEVADIPMQHNAAGKLARPAYSFKFSHKPTDGVEKEHQIDVCPITMRFTRYDTAGAALRTSEATLYEQALAAGWWPNALADSDVIARGRAYLLTLSLEELAGRDPVVQELLFRVVDEPSLWSVATSLGVKLTLHWQAGTDARPLVPVEGIAGDVRTAALELRINGSTASWVTMLVTPPNGATRACGGLVGAIAQHPSEAGRLAVVRLLATRRGAAPITR